MRARPGQGARCRPAGSGRPVSDEGALTRDGIAGPDSLGYLGADAVCSTPVTARSKKKEPLRSRGPTFAVGPGNREAYRRKVKALRAWRAAYYECLRRWKAGERDFLWPADTWKMRVLHGVKCVPS